MLTRLAVEFVIVFFLLSGFSIAHSLSDNKSPIPFYKRRIVRIYPSYLAALAWAALIFIITRAIFPQWYDGRYTEFSFIRTMQMNDFFEWKIVLKNLLYLPGEGFITPFWSLTFEVIFYLLAPFLLRKVNLYVIISAALFLLHWLIPNKILADHLPSVIYRFLFIYNIYFAAGVLLYQKWDTVVLLFTGVSRKLHLLAIIGIVLLMYAVNIRMTTESEYSFMVAACLSIFLIVYFVKFEVRIKWLMNVGKFSYTLYITHLATIFLYLAIYWLISGYRAPYIKDYYVWVGAVPLCVVVAYLQYKLVEKPTKSILNRMRQRDSKVKYTAS